ncbi:MAG: hypothetical protein RBS78_02930 [Coriobacteriia bacterium]|nr:hypothetical protein [Coriobacteriia bacterium]
MHTITVLHIAQCAGGMAALEIASALAHTRSDLTVEGVVITSAKQGAALGFRGSPTVLIDGKDIEADPRVPLGSMG